MNSTFFGKLQDKIIFGNKKFQNKANKERILTGKFSLKNSNKKN